MRLFRLGDIPIVDQDGCMGIYGILECRGKRFLTMERYYSDGTVRGMKLKSGLYNLHKLTSPSKGRDLLYISGNGIGLNRGFQLHKGFRPRHSEGCILIVKDLDFDGKLSYHECESFVTNSGCRSIEIC